MLQLSEKMTDLGIEATIMTPSSREVLRPWLNIHAHGKPPWSVVDFQSVMAPEFDSLDAQQPIAAQGSSAQLLEGEVLDGRLDRLTEWFSHLGALWDFLARDDAPDVAVVLGEQISPSSSDAQGLIDMISEFRRNVSSWVPRKTCKDEGWDLLCLSYFDEPEDSRNYADFARGVQPLLRPKCQQAYAITRYGARVLLDAALPVQVSADKLIMELTMSGQLRAFGPIVPFFGAENRIAPQSSSSSSTSSNVEGKKDKQSFRTLRPRSAYGEVALDEVQVRDLLEMRFGGLREARDDGI